MRRAALCASVLTALLVPAQAARAARLTLDAALDVAYDDNILQYSDTLLAVFAEGTRPELFSIRTSDDLVWNPSLALLWEAGAQERLWRNESARSR